MLENYSTQSTAKKQNVIPNSGRLLEIQDNWCLLPSGTTHVDSSKKEANDNNQWINAPHPHQWHPVLYVPGHWGSFSQARSLGAHGTRWAGPYPDGKSDEEIFKSFLSGDGMHDGWVPLNSDGTPKDWINQWNALSQQLLDGFVMDVFTLDFDGGEGAALHASKLLRQADFFMRAVETIVAACHCSNDNDENGNSSRQRGITIVAHSIGAWVVRIALRLHPHLVTEGWIRNVVTLASPHGGLVCPS